MKSDKSYLNVVILKINIFPISSEKNLSTAWCYRVGGAWDLDCGPRLIKCCQGSISKKQDSRF